MLQLNKQEKEIFTKLSQGRDGEILSEYIGKVIDEVSNVENLSMDIIENAKNVKAILKGQLQGHLDKPTIVEQVEDSYE